jgi:ornithine cyclodeaminase/alanine dehydrogenase-like protein (mu-crystallin family)
MAGYSPATALASKLVSVFPENTRRGLPSHQALIIVFDAETGTPTAIMDGTRITALRTAAASAVATRLLARPEANILAILGAGVQGAAHLEAIPRTRAFQEIRVASRDSEHARALAERHPMAAAARSFADAVSGADVVCACTDSPEPVVHFSELKAGVHVNSVGFSRGGPELHPGILDRAQIFVESRQSFAPFPVGARELEHRDPAAAAEIGEVLAGTRPGRTAAAELTVYKAVGNALEDAAAARLVLERAQETGAGVKVAF